MRRWLTRADVLADVGAAVEFLCGQGPGQLGLPLAGMVGLSIGGHIAYLAAAHLEIPATVVLYGGWIPTTDLPIGRPEPTIAGTPDITGRVLVLIGENDPVVPQVDRRAIGAALEAAGINHELVDYPGAGHAFLCDRRDSYHRESADDAWRRIARFLDPAAGTA